MKYELLKGDCLDHLKTLPDNSVDSIVTDPPYGLGKEPDALKMLTDWIETGHHEVKGKGFMGKEWDAFVPQPRVWHECLRVLKPGGHLLAFAGTRTQDLMTLGLRLAGFEIRDMVAWVYGSGFPKSLDVSKALDKMAGAEREVVGTRKAKGGENLNTLSREGNDSDNAKGCGAYGQGAKQVTIDIPETAPATEAAKQWDGWGTALKPALEPITLARKPLEGTVAANVLKWHTGALNIDGCRIHADGESFDNLPNRAWQTKDGKTYAESGHNHRDGSNAASVEKLKKLGRWPANLIHDGSYEVVSQFPDSKGQQGDVKGTEESRTGGDGTNCYGEYGRIATPKRGDSGSAARFFYAAKCSKSERGKGNNHPTVKPLALMRYLCRLITAPGGTILDPYLGSGSTGIAALEEGFDFIGIERDDNYFAIAEQRIVNAYLEGFEP